MALEFSRKMRSWLFAPGDSEKKMGKAAGTAADIVIIDLEDSVVPERKEIARDLVRDFLESQSNGRDRFWVRVNPLDGEYTLGDLAAVMPARPGGIMLPKIRNRADVETLDNYLSAFETANGIERGSTPVLALITETAGSIYHTGDYAGAPRVVAMSWGAEDLSDALGAAKNLEEDGTLGFTYQLARSLCLLGASHADVPAIETIDADFRNLDGLKARAQKVRRDGFRGMLAIHPAQIDVINAAFTPSEEDIAQAQDVIDLFAANPGAGTLGHNGKMLDRPHLARAQQILAAAEQN